MATPRGCRNQPSVLGTITQPPQPADYSGLPRKSDSASRPFRIISTMTSAITSRLTPTSCASAERGGGLAEDRQLHRFLNVSASTNRHLRQRDHRCLLFTCDIFRYITYPTTGT
jgi:hypothetical protein